MMENKVLSILNEMTEENGGKKLDKLDLTLSLRNDLNFDSLLLAELTVRIEDEFGVDIFEDGIIDTLGELIEKVQRG